VLGQASTGAVVVHAQHTGFPGGKVAAVGAGQGHDLRVGLRQHVVERELAQVVQKAGNKGGFRIDI